MKRHHLFSEASIVRYPLHTRLRRFLSPVSALFIFALFIPVAWAIPGDINGDGLLDEADLRLVENHITGKALLDPTQQVAADLNMNGQVDVGDLIGLAKMQTTALVIVPDVSWESRQRAEYLLEEAGLETGAIHEVASTLMVGMVAGQSPKPGLAVSPGSTVDLYVSAGPDSGSYLEITPTTVDLGVSGTQATFEIRCIGDPIPWTTGMWADYTASPPSGFGDGTVTLTLDRTRLPFGEGTLSFAAIPDVAVGATPAHAAVRFEQTVYPPPSLDFFNSPQPFSPGDTVRIGGLYFAENPEDNIIQIGGVQVRALRVTQGPPMIQFTVPSEVGVGMVEIRARREKDATFGPSDWGRAMVQRVVAPTEIALLPGPDGHRLWVEPSWRIFPGGDMGPMEMSVGPSDWVLGGRNLSLVGGALVDQLAEPAHIFGSSNAPFVAETIVDDRTFYLPARALGDDQVVVSPNRISDDHRNAFFNALQPGQTMSMRLWGSEKGKGYLRVTNWAFLKVAAVPPPIGSVVPISVSSLNLADADPDTVVEIAQGTRLFLRGNIYETETLRAPGLWEGDMRFLNQNDIYTAAGGFMNRVIHLQQPGRYTIENLTSGATRTIEVLEGGAPAQWFPDGDRARLSSKIYNVILPPDRDVTLMANGATVHIPAGALPEDDGVFILANFNYRQYLPNEIQYTLDDPEGADGGIRLDLYFRRGWAETNQYVLDERWRQEWDPPQLHRPITLRAFYGPETDLNGPPSLATLDVESGIYWELPSVADPSRRLLTLVLPAGTYGPDSSTTAASAPVALQSASLSVQQQTQPAGFPPVGFLTITRNMGIPYLRSARSVMRDGENWFAVDYISDSASSSYVTDAYAEGVLQTLVSTYGNLKGRNWREPGGTTWIYLRKTLLGGYGSTTKAVFGRPSVTINIAECPADSPAYYTTAAHEVAHVFQRKYTTNIVAKWFDEAVAEWVALDTVGAGNFLADNLHDALPFVKSLPGGFTFGYSATEGYAASPWAVWLEKEYSGSIRKVYEALDGNPLAWEDHYGVVADATGATIMRLYRDFACEYWLQSFEPTLALDLAGQVAATGKTIALTMNESGDVSWSDNRPYLSSMRFSVEPNQACLDRFAGRPAVIRFTPNDAALFYEVFVYGDRAGAANIPNQPHALTSFYPSGPDFFVLDNVASHRTYRFILANGATTTAAAFAPQLRMVVPVITALAPSTGAKRGGYMVSVEGNGFGSKPGSISISGAAIDLSSWTDTRIRFQMPDVGEYTQSWTITVRTAEDVATNSKTFTFTD